MNNPVAWQLFGDEAIELAKRENKLLFISIGYSACHCASSPPPTHAVDEGPTQLTIQGAT